MKFAHLITLVAGNLLRMKARVAMTAAGVLVGSSAVVLLIALGLGLQRNALNSLGNLGDLTLLRVGLPMGVEFSLLDSRMAAEYPLLDESRSAEIAALPGVIALSPQVYVRSPSILRLNNLEAYPPVFGVDAAALADFELPLASGKMTMGPGQVLLGAKAAESLFDPRKKEYVSTTLDWQDQTPDLYFTRYFEDGTQETRRFRVQVIGVLQETGGFVDYGAFITLEDARRLNTWIMGRPLDHSRFGYENLWVKTSDAKTAYQVEQTLTNLTYRVETNRTILAQMDQFFQFIQLMLGGIGAVALLVSAFGIANTMVMAIYERTREIGLLKSLGARNLDILMLFIGEAAAIGLLGGLGGVGAAYLLAEFSNQFGASWLSRVPSVMGPPGSIPGMSGGTLFEMPGWLMLFTLGFSTSVGILSGLYPAMRAAALDPLAALRHE